jgi:DASS family divalent anion:Na+ symporter
MDGHEGILAREALLRAVPFFAALERVELARLIGVLDEVRFPAGSIVVQEGADDDGLYLLDSGRVVVTVETEDGERTLAELESPGYFGELGLLLRRRTSTIRALTDVRLLRLPRDRFENLTRESPRFGRAVAEAAVDLLGRRERERVGAPVQEQSEISLNALPRPSRWQPLARRGLGAAAAVAAPAVLWWLPPPPGLEVAGWHVLLVMVGAAIGWLLEPVPDFVTALLMVAAWGVTGLAPLSTSFAGFTGPSWVVALGSLALAASMARSGLLFRFALLSLRVFPASHAGQTLALLLGGLLVTPLVPLGLARVAAVAPLTEELAEALHCPPGSRQRAGLAFAGLAGHGLFSSIFLSGLVMNFFVLDLLPAADRARFTWTFWLLAAAPVGAVILVGISLTLLTLFGGGGVRPAKGDTIPLQQRVLGPLSGPECVALIALAILLGGLILQPVAHIATEWLAIASLAILVGGAVLDRAHYQSGIDWGFLTLFGVLLGAGGVLREAGVDHWLGGLLQNLSRTSSPAISLVLLALCVCVVRLVLPWIPATLLLSLAVVPIAPALGISPWLAGFVVLVAAIAWLHPNQSDLHRVLRQTTRSVMFTNRQGLLFGVVTTAVVVLAIVAAIPYWWSVGLLAR